MDIHKESTRIRVFLIGEKHITHAACSVECVKQIDINDLDFRNKNVEKVTKTSLQKQALVELQEITNECNSYRRTRSSIKNDFFETGLYTVETNAKSGTYKVQATGAPAGVKFANEKGETKQNLM